MRTALIYLAVGAVISQAALMLVRATDLSPAYFQAVVSLLLLGLPIVLIGVSALEEQPATQQELEKLARSPWTSAPMALLLGVGALAVGASGWVVLPGGFGTALSRAPIATSSLIGLVPPDVESADPNDGIEANRFMSSLSVRLSAIGSLTILPDSVVEAYRAPVLAAQPGSGRTPSALLIEETVVRSGDEVQIRVQVLDSRTGEVVWEGGVTDPFRSVTEMGDSLIAFLMRTTAPGN